MEKMSVFGDGIDLQGLGLDDQRLMDYLVLVLVRVLKVEKAFKGGYVLNQLIEKSRMTHDVDFSISNKEDYNAVKDCFVKVAEVFKENGYIDSYRLKELSPQGSGGIDFYDKNGRKFLGVDVSVHDISWGVQSYNFDVATLDAFRIERMLADKLIAILSEKRFRRTKDLYDFYIITDTFDFSFSTLKEYLRRRGGAKWENIPFSEEVLVQYRKAWDKLVLQDVHGNPLGNTDFSKALFRFYSIALPCKDNDDYEKWNHSTLRLE